MFAIRMGVGRSALEAMSVPQMVDHVDYLNTMNEG